MVLRLPAMEWRGGSPAVRYLVGLVAISGNVGVRIPKSQMRVHGEAAIARGELCVCLYLKPAFQAP